MSGPGASCSAIAACVAICLGAGVFAQVGGVKECASSVAVAALPPAIADAAADAKALAPWTAPTATLVTLPTESRPGRYVATRARFVDVAGEPAEPERISVGEGLLVSGRVRVTAEAEDVKGLKETVARRIGLEEPVVLEALQPDRTAAWIRLYRETGEDDDGGIVWQRRISDGGLGEIPLQFMLDEVHGDERLVLHVVHEWSEPAPVIRARVDIDWASVHERLSAEAGESRTVDVASVHRAVMAAIEAEQVQMKYDNLEACEDRQHLTRTLLGVVLQRLVHVDQSLLALQEADREELRGERETGVDSRGASPPQSGDRTLLFPLRERRDVTAGRETVDLSVQSRTPRIFAYSAALELGLSGR